MFLGAFGAAFGLTFIAELGDKTQIAIINLSAKYRVVPVFLGAAIAFAVLNGLAVTVGIIVYDLVNPDIVRYVAAGVFIVFGLLSFRPAREEEKTTGTRNPLLATILLVGLLEFGDKTQIALVTLTAKYRSPLAVFLGGTIALCAASLIAALVGDWVSRIVPEKWIRVISGIVFILFGILLAVGLL